MKMLVVSIYDAASGAFMQPFFVRAKGEAIRVFSDACKDTKTQFFGHAGDYTLFHLGDFDDGNGLVSPLNVPERLITGLECVGPD